MNHTVVFVGEGKEAYYHQAFAEYKKRMAAFGSLEEVVLKPAKTPGGELSAEEIRLCLEKEAVEFERILKQPKYQKCFKIALCIEGKNFSSEQFGALMERAANQGMSGIVYLIGSSWGIAESVKARCDLRLSFSPMTFAHGLFRVMLAEQIYRACGILAGTKYHK